MADETNGGVVESTDQPQSEAAPGESVSAAVDALIESAKAEAGTEPVEVPPSAEGTARKKGTRRKSDEAVDTLVQTVNTLAATVTTLSSTIEKLGDAKLEAAKAPQPEPVVAESVPEVAAVQAPVVEEAAAPSADDADTADDAEESIEPSITGFLRQYAKVLVPACATAAVAWSSMRPSFNVIAIACCVVAVLATCGIAFVTARKLSLVAIVGEVLMVVGHGFCFGAVIFFSHHPDRAAFLAPVGFVCAVVGAALYFSKWITKEHCMWLAGGGVWIAFALYFGLHALAPSHGEATTKKTEIPAVGATHGEASHGSNSHDGGSAEHVTQSTQVESTSAPVESHEGAAAHSTPAPEASAKPQGVPLSSTDKEKVAEATAAAAAAAHGSGH